MVGSLGFVEWSRLQLWVELVTAPKLVGVPGGEHACDGDRVSVFAAGSEYGRSLFVRGLGGRGLVAAGAQLGLEEGDRMVGETLALRIGRRSRGLGGAGS